jgi:chromosome segregation ATPase
MGKVKETQEDKIRLYKEEIEKNSKVIRRSDKLIVDLQQKNELQQNAVIVTQEETSKKFKQKEDLQVKMRELSDQQTYFHESIGTLETKISTYKNYI